MTESSPHHLLAAAILGSTHGFPPTAVSSSFCHVLCDWKIALMQGRKGKRKRFIMITCMCHLRPRKYVGRTRGLINRTEINK